MNRPPVAVLCHTYTANNSQVPTSAAVALIYPQNRVVQATIGFDLEYHNSLEIWGKGFRYSMERSFTMPTDQQVTVNSWEKNHASHHTFPATNHFTRMLKAISRYTPKHSQTINQAVVNRSVILDAMIRSTHTHKLQLIHYPRL